MSDWFIGVDVCVAANAVYDNPSFELSVAEVNSEKRSNCLSELAGYLDELSARHMAKSSELLMIFVMIFL